MAHVKETIQLGEMFLEAAEAGDKKTILAALDKHHLFDVNCVDSEGKTALVLAVENAQTEIVEILASNQAVDLGDALLRAVSNNFIIETRVLLEIIEIRQLLPYGLYCRASNSDFHPYVTPVVLAAQNNYYDILKSLVLDYGARVNDPTSIIDGEDEDSLEHAVGALNLYRALTSEAYITLTADDPIECAFKLSRKMREYSIKNFEFRFEFDELAQKCEVLAADILALVQSTDELTVTLTHRSQENGSAKGDIHSSDSPFEELLVPHKIKTAIDYDQKKFVAHAHCQHRLVEMWYRGLHNWRRKSGFQTFSLSLLIMIFFPILSLCFIFAPHQRPGKLLKIPYVKFLCSVASTLTFLLLLTLQSFELQFTLHTLYIHVMGMADQQQESGHSLLTQLLFSTVEVLIVLWVIAYTWCHIRELWTNGVFKVLNFNAQGKLYDYFNLLLFWIWIILRLTVILKITNNNVIDTVGNNEVANSSSSTIDEVCPVENWETPELGCLNSKLDALLRQQTNFQVNITTIISQLEEIKNQAEAASATRQRRSPSPAKLINRGQGSVTDDNGVSGTPSIDEVQGAAIIRISLFAEGFIALAKTLCFLSLVRITVVHLLIGPMQISFGRMGTDIIKFMAIFILVLIAFSVGLHQVYHFSKYLMKLQECTVAGDLACSDSPDSLFQSISALFWTMFGMANMSDLKTDQDHWFTDILGYSMYAAYNLVAIVVLLNILIAMMSNTYTRIEEDADTHWKFSRATLWISFYDSSQALSPPFNLIPSMNSLIKICRCGALNCSEESKQVSQVFEAPKEHAFKLKSLLRKWTGKKPEVDKRAKSYTELMKELSQRYAFAKLKKDEEKKDPLIMQLKRDISGLRTETKESLDTMGHTMKEIAGEEVEEEENDLTRALEEVEKIAQQGPVNIESFRHPVNQTIREVDLPFADELSIKSEDDDPVRRSELLKPNSKWVNLRASVYRGRRRRSVNVLPSLRPYAAQTDEGSDLPGSKQLETEMQIRMPNRRKSSSSTSSRVSDV